MAKKAARNAKAARRKTKPGKKKVSRRGRTGRADDEDTLDEEPFTYHKVFKGPSDKDR